MQVQRWTLAVVCAATAMLMLDIAVVNTALSDIAVDLDTGLSGLQWVVDAYTLALAATVLTAGALADRLGRRKLFLVGLGAVHGQLARLCRGRRHRRAQRDARRAGRRRGDHVRRLAGAARRRLSGPAPARRRAGRLRRHDRRRVRGRAARRRRAHQRPRLALDLPHQPPDRPALHRGHPRLRAGVARPGRPPDRLARPDHADRGPVPARARAAARSRGRLDERPHPRRVRRRPRAARRVRGDRGAGRRADAPARPVPRPVVHRRADRRVRHLGVVLRDLPLHDALPAADPRPVGDRGRPDLPAGDDHDAVRERRDEHARGEGLGPGDGRRAGSPSSPSAWCCSRSRTSTRRGR